MSLLFAFFLFGSSSFCLPGRFPRLPFAVMDFLLDLRYERYAFMMEILYLGVGQLSTGICGLGSLETRFGVLWMDGIVLVV
jgi:hypothetical protein